MRGCSVLGLGGAGCRAVAQAVFRGAQVRAALEYAAGDAGPGLGAFGGLIRVRIACASADPVVTSCAWVVGRR